MYSGVPQKAIMVQLAACLRCQESRFIDALLVFSVSDMFNLHSPVSQHENES
jgi:hypothetical protein